jgi:hypothetical protein
MHWIITADHINTSPGDTTRLHYRGTTKAWNLSYRGANPEAKAFMLDAFKESMNYEFRLYDDDGELYYEGLCKDLDQANEDAAFRPLDWAMNDVGATTMKYRKKGETEWKTL